MKNHYFKKGKNPLGPKQSDHLTRKSGKQKTESDSNIYPDLFQMGKKLLTVADTDQLLTAAMDQLIRISGAERGMIVLFQGDEEAFQTARNLEQEDIDNPGFEISRTIIRDVRTTGEPAYHLNALEDPQLKQSSSVIRLKILSVICLPLKIDNNVFGVIYLDNRTVRGAFEPETNAFVREFADFISLAAHRALEYGQLDSHIQKLEQELRTRYDFKAIAGHAPNMVAILQTVSRIADTDITVLIEGETGTGKELVARSIHFNSPRKDRSLVNINCGAIPENLLESELFGYEKGAFTGAYRSHKGRFEQADGGTIFLDEVDEMSPALQVKVLRILQWGEFSPLGSDATKHCDVRIVAASKVTLAGLVRQGKFRDDLYYRLNLMRIEMPALRERKEDIPLLIRFFLERACSEYAKTHLVLHPEVQRVLEQYDYPGNVRELENIITHAVILCDGETIQIKHLPSELQTAGAADERLQNLSFKDAKQRLVEDFERNYLKRLLKESGGVIREAAKRAGIHEKNFYEKMVKYGFHGKQFKGDRKKHE